MTRPPSLFLGQGPTGVTADLKFLVRVRCPGLRSPLGDPVMSGSQRGPALTQAWVPLSPPRALKPPATELCKCCVRGRVAALSLPLRAVIS